MQTPHNEETIFSKILRGEQPCFKVYEDSKTFVFMDIMPRGKGHTLVIPKKKVRTILEIDTETYQAVSETTRRIACAVFKAFQADGVTIEQSNEAAAGQVIFHLHVHVIPRFKGIDLKPHGYEKADSEKLEKDAEKIAAVLSSF